MSTDFKTLLKGARLPERSVPVCLRGDLVADHEAAERDLEQAKRNPGNSLAGTGEGALVDRIEALQADMQEHTYPFRLRALPRHEFRTLVLAHPPRREGDGDGELIREDAILGVNRETFFDQLIRSCVIDPQLDGQEWDDLLGNKLTDRQHGDLSDAAWFLNRGEVDVPFSLAASRSRRSTEAE